MSIPDKVMKLKDGKILYNDLRKRVSDLNSALNNKAPIILSTASGDIASFDDGADGMPVKELTVGIEPVQDLHGYDSPWPGGGGKNLFDIEKATLSNGAYGFSMSRDGDKITVSGTATSSGNLSFAITTTYADDSLSGKGYVCQVFDWTGNKTFGSCWGFRTESERAFALSINNVAVGDNVNVSFKISVAETSQSSYAPYSNLCPITGWTGCNISHSGADTSTPTVYPITFPSEAGTVYGGSFTVNEDGTGQLVVDANMLDMGDFSRWANYGGSYPNLFYTTLTGAVLPPNNFTVAQIKSTIYHVERSSEIGNAGYTNGYIGLNSNGRLYVNDDRYSTVQDFVSGVTGQKVWYKLATPITYTLTALEVLETLKGVNNIWADCGNTSVTYRADTKAYVDNAAPEVPVQDVQVNGQSVVQNGVANVPVASNSTPGVVRGRSDRGITIVNDWAQLATPSDNEIKTGDAGYKSIVPSNQHKSTFYGLAKAAGDTTQSSSSNAVGAYTDAAKQKIRAMLGIKDWQSILLTESDYDTTVKAFVLDVGNGNEIAEARVYGQIVWDEAISSILIGVGFGNVSGYNNYNKFAAKDGISSSKRISIAAEGKNFVFTSSSGNVFRTQYGYGYYGNSGSNNHEFHVDTVTSQAMNNRGTCPYWNWNNPRYFSIYAPEGAAWANLYVEYLLR